ncbi:glycoside hydrolase family 5 protein [Roridomyces roridus]|uniref:mannan endo-1,4-beta-mannosidase n=1 Tax=Roridomyces roridus TaxID=1738132 RepID=A0AAD7BWR7_9AGAR|nr:glycoside hydrolase family 5 protein [Roridomyces roridus]
MFFQFWLGLLLVAVGVSATSSKDPRWQQDPPHKRDPTPTTAPAAPTIDKSQFVSTQDGSFHVNNSEFKFIGTNAYWLSALNSDEDIDHVLGNISQFNITVVRTWAFNDVSTIPENGTWFQLVANGTTSVNLNETTGLPKLDRMVAMAEKHGIYLLFSLTNNWNPIASDPIANSTNAIFRRDVLTNNSLPRNTLSNDYGGMDAYVRAFGADTHDAFYTNETIIQAFENYTTQIVQRYVNSTSVLAWEIANDPRCNSSVAANASCNTNTITNWHNRIANLVKSKDPNHLVSSGTQGFQCMDCLKLFDKPLAPPPPGPSAAPNARRSKVVPLTKKALLQERKEAWKLSRALKLRSEPRSAQGVQVRGKWTSTLTRRQDDVGVGSAFDGSSGVDSDDILSIPNISFGSFQLFPDQNQYAPDDPSLSAFNNTLQAGLQWIQKHGESSQRTGKPVALTGFGLVTQDSAPFFVPFNSTVAPFAADQIGNFTTNSSITPFGVTQEQQNDAYTQWLQQGILSGLAGMIQYQWGQGNLTAMNGTAISPVITENGIQPVQDQNGVSPNDGYSSVGVGQVPTEGTLQAAAQQFGPDA